MHSSKYSQRVETAFPQLDALRYVIVVVVVITAAVAEPFTTPVHPGIRGYLPLTFMFAHQAALHWASIPDAVMRRDACCGADSKTTTAWICEKEIGSVMSFRDLVFARAHGGNAVDHQALSDAAGELLLLVDVYFQA